VTWIAGIDPSLTGTGIACRNGTTFTVRTQTSHGDARLARIYRAVADITIETEHAVIEDLPTHAHGAGLTGMVQGVIRLALIDHEVPYTLVPAATLKKYATGKGNATKPDMRMELFKRAGIDLKDDNQVDAWWLRALGMDLMGEPVLKLPQSHRDALAKLEAS
jgi:Holliday junction resolvasome RuvABC endonuclease subunit